MREDKSGGRKRGKMKEEEVGRYSTENKELKKLRQKKCREKQQRERGE